MVNTEISILEPTVIIGLFIGGMLPFLFSAMTMESVSKAAYQMINTEIRLIIFFAAKYGNAVYSQQKQDWELTVAQIMNSLLPNSDLY